MLRRSFMQSGLVLALAPASAPLWAQAYPVKPIRLIVPALAGTSTDISARILSAGLTTSLGQPVVIDNRPGAGGNIGFEAMAKAPPDGYSIGLVTNGLLINPFLYRKVSYDPISDFVPIILTVSLPQILIVRPDSPFRTVSDLIEALKAQPGKFNYASGGNGSPAHLCAELFKSMSGTDVVHVPYRGATEIQTSVMAGLTAFGFPTMSTAVALVKSGKLRALAVTSPKRNPVLPDVPAINEFIKGFEVTTWMGLVAPANTPAESVRRIEQEVSKVLADPATREKIHADGTEVVNEGSASFAKTILREQAKWKDVVQRSGAQVD